MAIHHVSIKEDEQKRIRRQFDDNRIVWGWNPIFHRYEVWYKPSSSRPYMVCTAENVSHAIRQLEVRARYEKKRAIDTIKEIDEFNENLITQQQADAMAYIRSELKNVACGKQHFRARN